MKLVLDTNVLISGAVWSGAASRLLNITLAGPATLCLSEALLAEFSCVLQRDKFRDRVAACGLSAGLLVLRFREAAQIFEPMPLPVPAALRDPDDIHVLACAQAAAADAIVTGDDDLLALQSFQGIPIIRVEEAIKWLKLSDP